MNLAICPRCKLDISRERCALRPVICDHCGFTSTKEQVKVQNQVESKFIKAAVGISLLIAVSFVQVATWDSHFLKVIPLQVKQLIGSMSVQDHEDMASICFERKKYDCVEKMYGKTAAVSLENRARYADFLVKRDKIRLAAEQYQNYFSQGGVDLQVTYNYAKTLSQLGEFEEASNLFKQVIDAKPDTVQITVLQHYVRSLIHANQLDKAKSIIEDVRDKSAQANAFMEEEMLQIKEKTS